MGKRVKNMIVSMNIMIIYTDKNGNMRSTVITAPKVKSLETKTSNQHRNVCKGPHLMDLLYSGTEYEIIIKGETNDIHPALAVFKDELEEKFDRISKHTGIPKGVLKCTPNGVTDYLQGLSE